MEDFRVVRFHHLVTVGMEIGARKIFVFRARWHIRFFDKLLDAASLALDFIFWKAKNAGECCSHLFVELGQIKIALEAWQTAGSRHVLVICVFIAASFFTSLPISFILSTVYMPMTIFPLV